MLCLNKQLLHLNITIHKVSVKSYQFLHTITLLFCKRELVNYHKKEIVTRDSKIFNSLFHSRTQNCHKEISDTRTKVNDIYLFFWRKWMNIKGVKLLHYDTTNILYNLCFRIVFFTGLQIPNAISYNLCIKQ